MKIPAQKCSAHNRRGELCGRWAIAGGRVCRFHGGAAKHVKEAAALRIARLVDPAINIIAGELQRKVSADDLQGRALRVKVAHDALDRNGLAGKQKLEVGTYSIDLNNLSEDDLKAILALKERLSGAELKKPEPEPA